MSLRARRVEPAEPAEVDGVPFRSDYADRFEVTAAESRPAEVWARQALEQGPAGLRWFVMTGWRFVLRLRLRPRDDLTCVAGWPILVRAPEIVVLGVESAVLGRARLTFRSSPETASVATDLQFEHRGAPTVWTVAGLLHRRILPYLLGHAASASPPVPDGGPPRSRPSI